MIQIEKIGFALWEAITLLAVMLVGIGIMVLRRKASGRPVFSDEDRQLFFGRLRIKAWTPKHLVKLGIAAFLCFLLVLLEMLMFAPLGAATLTVVLVLTSLAIVKIVIF